MILVLGATGFLGKRVCRMLDGMRREYARASRSLGTDLRSGQQTNALFERVRPDYVLNCAAYVGGIQFGLAHAGELFRNNMLMEVHLLEACRRFGVKRLVNPISNCAYPGEATLFREDEFWNGPLHESVEAYGLTRKMLFAGASAYRSQYGMSSIHLVLSNMYGPEDHFEEERSHALGALIMKIVEARDEGRDTVTVWGSGDPVREWLHVDDGAQAMIRALDIDDYDGVINIGVAKGISVRDMAGMIAGCAGYTGTFVYDASRPDGAPYKTVDGSLGRRLMNWSPEIPFAEGVAQTVAWYEAHGRGKRDA